MTGTIGMRQYRREAVQASGSVDDTHNEKL